MAVAPRTDPPWRGTFRISPLVAPAALPPQPSGRLRRSQADEGSPWPAEAEAEAEAEVAVEQGAVIPRNSWDSTLGGAEWCVNSTTLVQAETVYSTARVCDAAAAGLHDRAARDRLKVGLLLFYW